MADGSLNKIDIPKEVFALYDAYCHGDLSRRAFFSRLSAFAGGGVTVSMLAACVMPDYSRAQTASGEPDLIEEEVTYASPAGAGTMGGYLVRPANASGPLPGILVIHENRGLNPHIRDVVRRAAKAGYVAFGPDALYPLGGYPGNDDDGRALQAERSREAMYADFVAGAEFLRDHAAVNGKVAASAARSPTSWQSTMPGSVPRCPIMAAGRQMRRRRASKCRSRSTSPATIRA